MAKAARRIVNRSYSLHMTRGWWLKLPVIVGDEMTDVEFLVEPDEIPTLIQTWKRNGIRSENVDYKVRYGYEQTARQRRASGLVGGSRGGEW